MKQHDMFNTTDELYIKQIAERMRADKNYHGNCIDAIDTDHSSNGNLDAQTLKWLYQYDSRGFDDTELFDLDATLAKFILPRLKAFSEKNFSLCASYDHEGDDVFQKKHIDKMIACFEQIADHNFDIYNQDDIREGLTLFAKFFRALYL